MNDPFADATAIIYMEGMSGAKFCGSCGAAIDPANRFCPSCGASRVLSERHERVSDDAAPSVLLSSAEVTDDLPKTSRAIWILVIVGICIAAFVLLLSLNSMATTSENGSSSAGPTDDQIGAHGEDVVKAGLRDPMSAIFTNVRGDVDEGCAYGTVNAKNGFGGYSGTDDYIVRNGVITFNSAGLLPYTEALNGCGVDGARKKIKTETDPKMRALLQNVLDTAAKTKDVREPSAR